MFGRARATFAVAIGTFVALTCRPVVAQRGEPISLITAFNGDTPIQSCRR